MALAPLEVRTPESLGNADEIDDFTHLFCPRRNPHVMFCGLHDPTLPEDVNGEEDEDAICPPCRYVWEMSEPICPRCQEHINTHF